MKIIFISNTCWSLYNFRYDLIKFFSKKNQVFIIAKMDETFKHFEKLGCKCINVSIDQRGTNLYSELKSLIQIYKKIYKIKPDKVFSFTLKGIVYSGISKLFQNFYLNCTLDGLGIFKLKNKFFLKFIIFILKISQKKTDSFFFVSKNDFNFFEKYLILQNNIKKEIIPGTGINTKFFSYKRINLDNISFTYIGRFLYLKGIKNFIEASINLKKKFPNVKFNLIGRVDYNDKNSLNETELNNYKKLNKINFFEFKSDIRQVIQESTCIVLPTSYPEGIPRSLLEAISIGRLIITSSVGGCSEVLKNGINGFVCKENNQFDLEIQMTKIILMNKNNKFLFSTNSRKLAIRKFKVEKIIKIYQDILYDKY